MPPTLEARVIGAGPTGCLAALALAEAGWRVTLHDPLPAEGLTQRQRAYAFTHSSRLLLERLRLWSGVEPLLVPFHSLVLLDQGLGRRLGFRGSDLPRRCRPAGLLAGSGPQAEAAAVGWIGRHAPLMELLLAQLARHPRVNLQLGSVAPEPLASGCALVVAADGPGSPSRQALGIGSRGWAYRQRCLTAEVQLRGAAPGQAWEVLRPEGPLAVLPLESGWFQLVWSAPAERCRSLEALDPAAFLDRLAAVLPDGLEPDALRGDVRSFPVGLALAGRLSLGPVLLVGESGHRCHPVGGQGLNLCWRDVAVLHRLAQRAASGRLSVARLGAAYGRRRWPDLLLVLFSTDLLVRLFSNRHPLLLPLRRLALLLLGRSRPLRRLVLGTMTGGCSPLPPAGPVATLA
jgi:2-octaprenyl-6-methoxyphenol hydroxylase